MSSNNRLFDIKSSSPILIVYPAGIGGEHIAHTLSICSDRFQSLETVYNEDTNQFHTQCFINYSADIVDLGDFNCGINEYYTEEYNANKRRLIFKDHPTQRTLEFYKNHLPDIKVLFITPYTEHNYFAELTFKKLAKKVNSSSVDEKYINFNVVKNISKSEIDYIISQVNQHEWVWSHEIHNFIVEMRNTKNPKLMHSDSLDKITNDHKSYLINIIEETSPAYITAFKNFHLINSDDLRSDSFRFWKSIHSIEDSINVSNAVTLTNTWIEKNNKLINPFNNYYEVEENLNIRTHK